MFLAGVRTAGMPHRGSGPLSFAPVGGRVVGLRPGQHGPPPVHDIDIRTLPAFSSHLARRRLLAGRDAGKRPISAASRNLHLIALRGLLKFGVLLDLPVPAPKKVELAKAPEPSPDARHLDGKKLERLLETIDTSTDEGVRARALLELLVASGCRISDA